VIEMFFDRIVEELDLYRGKYFWNRGSMFLARCGVFEFVGKSDVLWENIFLDFDFCGVCN